MQKETTTITQITVATCPNSKCGAPYMPGSRFCGICRENLINPSVGRLAEPSKRLFAFVLDFIIPVAILFIIVISGLFSLLGALSHNGVAKATGSLLTLALPTAFIGYVVWCFRLFCQGMTPGKLAFGMRVVKKDGSQPGFLVMLIREWIGKWISGFLFSLGYTWDTSGS